MDSDDVQPAARHHVPGLWNFEHAQGGGSGQRVAMVAHACEQRLGQLPPLFSLSCVVHSRRTRHSRGGADVCASAATSCENAARVGAWARGRVGVVNALDPLFEKAVTNCNSRVQGAVYRSDAQSITTTSIETELSFLFCFFSSAIPLARAVDHPPQSTLPAASQPAPLAAMPLFAHCELLASERPLEKEYWIPVP